MPAAAAESPGLFSNFVEYVNDNVCMMAMAATIGNLASGLAGKVLGPTALAGSSVWQAQAQMVICFLLICLLRLLGLALRRAAGDGTMRDVYTSMLAGLPWFLRVPMVTLLPAYFQEIYALIGWNPSDVNTGKACVAFILNMLIFIGLFFSLLGLGWLMRSLPDASHPEARWSAFLAQCFYLAFLSGSGKAMHFTVRIVLLTLIGPTDPNPTSGFGVDQVACVLVCMFMLTVIAACLLASAMPNEMTNPLLEAHPFTKIHLTCQQYVIVYTWAYAIVNLGWDAIYKVLGGQLTSHWFGFFMFIYWLFTCLMTACVFANSTPDKNFYDMGKSNSNKQAACLMNYWLVDFITWWAQSQAMTTLDDGVEHFGKIEGVMTQSSWPVIGINFIVIVALLFLVGALSACNHKALLFKMARDAGLKSKALLVHIAASKNFVVSEFLVELEGDEDEDDDSKAEEE